MLCASNARWHYNALEKENGKSRPFGDHDGNLTDRTRSSLAMQASEQVREMPGPKNEWAGHYLCLIWLQSLYWYITLHDRLCMVCAIQFLLVPKA